jgi:hypothetical protein
MEESELESYRNLQQHMDTQPIGYPPTESGIELKVLKHLFTQEEAEIASNMNYVPEKLKLLSRKLKKAGLSIIELEEKLDKMFEKGTIMRIEREGIVYYWNIPFVIGIYENQVGRLTKEFYIDADEYIKDYFKGAYNTTAVPQLRVIPIEEIITPEQSIANYDELRTVIENSDGIIGIMECICRQGKDLIGEPCKKSDLREVCFSFRTSAKEMHERGAARLINKEEALSILKKVEEAGFVL